MFDIFILFIAINKMKILNIDILNEIFLFCNFESLIRLLKTNKFMNDPIFIKTMPEKFIEIIHYKIQQNDIFKQKYYIYLESINTVSLKKTDLKIFNLLLRSNIYSYEGLYYNNFNLYKQTENCNKIK
jgi:hypothetical protein